MQEASDCFLNSTKANVGRTLIMQQASWDVPPLTWINLNRCSVKCKTILMTKQDYISIFRLQDCAAMDIVAIGLVVTVTSYLVTAYYLRHFRGGRW